jgi:hypothetical protein
MPGCNDGVSYEERLRDEFARDAMHALLPGAETGAGQIAFVAYALADAMMEAREADLQRREEEAAGERDGA